MKTIIKIICIVTLLLSSSLYPQGRFKETPPKEFVLHQSYPGPSTFPVRIKYEIAESCFVTLKVYNIIGNELETLVNTQLKPGYYEAIWEGKVQPSGVYFYKLSAAVEDEVEFTDTKKVVVVR